MNGELILWEEIFLSFLAGLFSGIIIQSLRFRYERRLDMIRRLMPYMETLHPIFESFVMDVEHVMKLQEINDAQEFDRYVGRISETLNTYGSWYSAFVAEGMKPELQSLNYDLYAALYGIFVYYQMSRKHGDQFLSQHLVDLQKDLKRAKILLEQFLTY